MENDSTHVEENESLEPDSDMRTLSLPSLSESTYLDNHLLAHFPKFNLPLVHSLLIAMAMILSCALGIGIGLYIGESLLLYHFLVFSLRVSFHRKIM